MENFLTVKEICGILKVKRGTVIRWIRTGKLQAFKFGGGRVWRIQERNLKMFIRGGSDAPMFSSDGKAPAESKSF